MHIVSILNLGTFLSIFYYVPIWLFYDIENTTYYYEVRQG